jgi:hypothetical protein
MRQTGREPNNLARLHLHITASRCGRRIPLPVWYIEMDAILLAAYILGVPEPNTAPLAASCHQHLLEIATNYNTGGS